MKHNEALSECWEPEQRTNCDGELIDPNPYFSDDVNWMVYTCEECLATVFLVEDHRHWWNHNGIPSEARKAKQDAMRQERLQVVSP